MANSDENVVRRFFEEIANEGKLEVADEIIAPGHVNHDPNTPWVPEGPEGIKQLVGAYREAFPDLWFEILDMFSSEGRVAHRWVFTGTHEGEMFGVPPTGERVEVSGVELHHVRDGRVAETWVGYDALGLMHQFGLEPRRANEA